MAWNVMECMACNATWSHQHSTLPIRYMPCNSHAMVQAASVEQGGCRQGQAQHNKHHHYLLKPSKHKALQQHTHL